MSLATPWQIAHFDSLATSHERGSPLLNEFEVEYLIVGGFAVMKYGEPRYTKDLDVWVHNSPHNSARIVRALRKFGAPLEHDGITTETFTGKQVVYQIGIAPVRIDILTKITGVGFPDAWGKRVASTFFGVPVNFISLDDLVTKQLLKISPLRSLTT